MENKIIQKFGQIISLPWSGKTTCQTIKDFYNNFNICKNLTDEKGINLRLCCINLIEYINIYAKIYFFKCNDKFRITTNKFNIKMWFIKWIKKNNKFPFDLEFF